MLSIKSRRGREGPPQLLEGPSSCPYASPATFTLQAKQPSASTASWTLKYCYLQTRSATRPRQAPPPPPPRPGPDLQVSLLRPGREVCGAVVWSHGPLPAGVHLAGCTLSASLAEVRLQFRLVALGRKQYFLCPALTTTVLYSPIQPPPALERRPLGNMEGSEKLVVLGAQCGGLRSLTVLSMWTSPLA